MGASLPTQIIAYFNAVETSDITFNQKLRRQSEDFYALGFGELVERWDKCINVGTGYVEKCFFRVRILHVLRFISFRDLFTDSPLYYTITIACTHYKGSIK
jgi:hypothetical protein